MKGTYTTMTTVDHVIGLSSSKFIIIFLVEDGDMTSDFHLQILHLVNDSFLICLQFL